MNPPFRHSGVAVLAGLLLMSSAVTAFAADTSNSNRPSVVWIVSEDNSPFLGCYGDELAQTPNIDALAKRSVRYDMAFANCPVCAPARFTLMHGVTAQQMGTMPMRSAHPIPQRFTSYPEILKNNGVYCTNASKKR